MDSTIAQILRKVRKPYRYLGGEVGAKIKRWDEAGVKICLIFPDTYEIGMSHLGLSILYHIANAKEDILAERCFVPWRDMEEELQVRGVKPFSLESHRPIDEFDMLGFSLAYELTYTNVLTMLKLAGIPIYASDRGDQYPLIVAGGPCTWNPMPVSPFFDVMAIGDGEDLIALLSRIIKVSKKSGEPKDGLLRRLAKIQGLYVPSQGCAPSGTGRAIVADLNVAPYPSNPVVPYAATHMRASIEVSRGCARGCRFCQAGFIYRPVRQREGETAVKLLCEGILSTGHEEFSFLSLSIGDWPSLEYSLWDVHSRCGALPVDASLPSLRVESMTDRMMGSMGHARSGSFTLAPEAGTERMRKIINKGNTDDNLYASAEKIFSSGWHAIKLYFMMGLPGETDDDLEGMIKIANRCLDIGRRHHRRPDITVSTSIFIPKAHTPFQWERQISIDEARGKQELLKKRLKRPGLRYKWHDAGMSFLEGVFARGGSELAKAIEIAHELGARFDGWDECFDLSKWKTAFARAKVDADQYLQARGFGFEFPWDHLKLGPSKNFLIKECDRARLLRETPDCTRDACSDCRMCDFDEIRNRLAAETASGVNDMKDPQGVESTTHGARRTDHDAHKYRIQYFKEGRAAFLGGLEVTDALRLALRASGLPMCYSEGFHPRVKVSVGPALPIGIESQAEFVDVELSSEVGEDEILKSLEGRLPEGMSVIRAWKLKPNSPSIDDAVAGFRYEIDMKKLDADLKGGISRFESSDALLIQRVRGKSMKEVDLKMVVQELAVSRDHVLGMTILNIPPLVRATEVISSVFGVTNDELNKAAVRKVGVEMKSEQCTVNCEP